MRYIANVITKNKLQISEFFNVTPDFASVDTSLPTLIIGWKEVKELFPDQDILEYVITPTISWTFSKKEKRYKYEKDIKDFIEKVTKSINETVNYRFFNFLLASEHKRNNFISYVNQGNCSIYYNSRFMYIYNPSCGITLGLSLQDLRYINIDITSFIQSLNTLNNNIITNNLSFLSSESLPLIKENIKSVPYLNYLRNCDIYKEKQ